MLDLKRRDQDRSRGYQNTECPRIRAGAVHFRAPK